MSLLAASIVLRHTQDQLAIDGERLDDDVKAFPIGVREGRADVDPEIVSALALHDNIDAVRGLGIRCHDSLRQWPTTALRIKASASSSEATCRVPRSMFSSSPSRSHTLARTATDRRPSKSGVNSIKYDWMPSPLTQ